MCTFGRNSIIDRIKDKYQISKRKKKYDRSFRDKKIYLKASEKHKL